jgi:hypothetical protein
MKLDARLICGATFVALVGCGDPQVSGGNGNGTTTPGGNGNTGGSSGGSSSGGGGFTLPDPPAGGGMAPGGPTMPSNEMNCGVKRHTLEKRPADLLLVLDRSGSMVDSVTDPATGMGVEKWGATVGALDAVLQATQAQVSWGLKLYPVGGEQCNVADAPEVPVAAANHAAVLASINSMPAVRDGGSTPTQAAVRKATTVFQGTPSPNNRFLLVATDGEPNCATDSGGGGFRGRSDRAGAVAAVTDALKAGIPSFIVGIATSGSEAHDTLNMMADAGGRPRNDATKYYPVASRAELITALEVITGQIASCTFPLDTPPPVVENVAVEVDGARLARDNQVSGWSYGPNNRSIVLNGEVCDRLKAGTAKDVQILYGCPGAIIP